jgi:hypothetical protein
VQHRTRADSLDIGQPRPAAVDSGGLAGQFALIYGSEGWGFASLRARSPYPQARVVIRSLDGSLWRLPQGRVSQPEKPRADPQFRADLGIREAPVGVDESRGEKTA